MGFMQKKDVGKDSKEASGLGHLANLPNNTNPKWWLDPGLRKLHFLLVALTLCSVNSGFDGSLINNLQSLDTWNADLDNPDANMLGVIGALQTVGAFAFCPLAPLIADRLGRRWAILVGGTVMFTGGLIQTFSNSPAQYIVGRFIVGGGNVIGLVGGTSLVNELAHPRTRSYIIGYFNVIWYIGAIIASWLCYGLTIHLPGSSWQWRLPTLFISIFAAAMVTLFWFVPESPRWLISKDKDDEAHRILADLHANGFLEDQLVVGEMLEIKHTLRAQQASISEAKTWRECFGSPGDRWRMFICIGLAICNNWTGQSIVSYYNTQILKQAGVTKTLPQLGINGGLSIFDFFCALLGAWLSGQVGRRPLFMASFIGMTSAHAVVTGLSARYAQTQTAGYGYAVIAFIWVESGFYNIALNPLIYAYTSEVLSFSTRAKGMALFLFTGDWNAIISRYCNPLGLADLGWKYYMVFLAFYVLETAFIYFYFPETKGRTLEEIAEIFDGIQVADQVVAEMGKARELSDEPTDKKGRIVIEGQEMPSKAEDISGGK
ncbi:general substrate transporter [Xylariaceae sp. FL0016]|nr:general substrate transporter [Xylariaceae sp. FL0016]